MKQSKRDAAVEERRIRELINAKNHTDAPNEVTHEADIEDDGYDWDAIEAYGNEILIYQSSVDQVVSKLEEKYAQESLKFTLGFVGNIPLVAYGTVFGQYFSFRFRGDAASLSVGMPDVEGDIEIYENQMKRWRERQEEIVADFEAGNIDQTDRDADLLLCEITKPEEPNYDRDNVVPGIIHKSSYMVKVTGEPYNSHLDPEQMETVFIHLMETLERHDPPKKHFI